MHNERRIRIECTDCHFSKLISQDDDKLPADIVTQHGRTTGHTLKLSHLDEKEDPLSP